MAGLSESTLRSRIESMLRSALPREDQHLAAPIAAAVAKAMHDNNRRLEEDLEE